MPILYYTDYSNPDFTQQRVVSSFLNIELPIQQIANKYSPLALVDESVLLNQANAISVYLASLPTNQTHIFGRQFEEEVQVYSWLEYFNSQIYPLVKQISGQIFGKMQLNQKRYQYAIEELKRVLKVLEQRLRLRTYFVGNSLTLADIVFCCQLQSVFRLVITSQIRKKFNNLMRWFTFVRGQQPFVKCIGKIHLCQNSFPIEFNNQKSAQKAQPSKKQTQNSQQNKSKKKEQAKQHSDQGKKEKVHKQQHKKQQKTQQKQGQFNLDNFKRNFQNSQNKQAIINELLQNFPPGWSVWKIYYNKDVTQGKVDYLTSNLAKGTLQRLQGLRKTGFGYWGVYHSSATQQYQIRGVMLWKGQELATAWKEHPSHQYHIFEKLDSKNPQHRKVIKDYWLQSQSCEGLTYHNSFKLI